MAIGREPESRAALGARGEDAARAWYRDRGYREIVRNWRCRLGELDLVVWRGGTLAVCEVKARRGSAFGAPHEAVTARKRAKLRALTEVFLASAGSELAPARIRFDVASVTVDSLGRLAVHVFEDAF